MSIPTIQRQKTQNSMGFADFISFALSVKTTNAFTFNAAILGHIVFIAKKRLTLFPSSLCKYFQNFISNSLAYIPLYLKNCATL